MSRRRRRRSSNQNNYVSMTGRTLSGPRSLALRPRSLTAVTNTLAMIRARGLIQRAYKRLPGRKVATVIRRPSRVMTRLLKSLRPRLPRQNNICRRRRQTREQMFAKQIAGRAWGAGGPNMFRARHTLDSHHTCRR